MYTSNLRLLVIYIILSDGQLLRLQVPSQNGGDAVSCRITGKRHTTNSEIVYAGDDGTQQRSAAAFKCAPPPGRDADWSETAWCFYIALQEPSCLDQWHADEDVSWMVIEEGSWLSDDGKQVQSGVVTAASGGWTWVPYRGTGFANSPVTITQIQTMKGQHCTNDDGSGTNTVGTGASCAGANEGWQNAISENNDIPPVPTGFTHTRQTKNSMNQADGSYGAAGTGASTSGATRKDTMHFFVTLETEGHNTGNLHSAVLGMQSIQEEVGWAAFDVGHSSMGAVTYEAGKTAVGSVTEQPYTIQFSGVLCQSRELQW